MRRRSRRLESLDAARQRIIRETEQALLFGLEHPRETPRIPTVEVGRARFDRRFSARFWAAILELVHDPAASLDPAEVTR